MARIRRRVVFAVEFEHEDAEIGALQAAVILHRHAAWIEQTNGAVDQVGVQKFPEGNIHWQALDAGARLVLNRKAG